jgi:hypothetical protein
MSWTGTERRREKRYGIKKLAIRYSKSRFAEVIGNMSEKYLVLNVSEQGVNFMTRKELKPGEKICIRMMLPEQSTQIHGVARIIWSKKSVEHDAFRIGAEIIKINKPNKNQLKILLADAVLDKIDFSTGIYLREVDRL